MVTALRRTLIVTAVGVCVVWTALAALIHARAFWFFAVLVFGPLLIGVAALVASSVAGRVKPTGFVVRESVGFVVPASAGFPFLAVGEVAMAAFLTGQMIRVWTWDGFDAVVRVWVSAVLSVALLVAYGLVALLVATALSGGPRILLTAGGVVTQDWWGDRVVPWEVLRPGQPVRRVRGGNLALIVDRPQLVVRRGFFPASTERPWLNLAHLRVDPGFLAEVIRSYVAHPERREAIGERTEYQRLLAELGVPGGGGRGGADRGDTGRPGRGF